MVGITSISPFAHPLDFVPIHVVDQDVADFAILPHLDLSTHDGFSFPCSQAIPNDDNMDNDAY